MTATESESNELLVIFCHSEKIRTTLYYKYSHADIMYILQL